MRAPRLHIHAGLPKTGTTAIQAGLAANRGRLEQAGLHLADTGFDPRGNHHALFWALGGPDPRRRRRAVAALLREAARGDLLVSSEFALLALRFAWGAHGFAALRDAGFGLRFVVFLRPQADFALSAYPEFLRNMLLPQTFEGFLARQAMPLVGDYGELIVGLKQWGDVMVLPYLAGQSWPAILRVFDLEAEGLVDPGLLRRSLDANGVAALQAAVAQIAPCIRRWNARLDLRRETLVQTGHWDTTGPAYCPGSPGLLEAIRSRSEAGNDEVAVRHWGAGWSEVFGDPAPAAPQTPLDNEQLNRWRGELVDRLTRRLGVIGGRPRTLRGSIGRPFDIAADKWIARRVLPTRSPAHGALRCEN